MRWSDPEELLFPMTGEIAATPPRIWRQQEAPGLSTRNRRSDYFEGKSFGSSSDQTSLLRG